MYFSKLIVTITAALVASAAAAPQRNGNNRGNRITVTDSVITQSNVCGNKSQNPYCCASDRGSGGNVCTVSSNIGGICDGIIVCCNALNTATCFGNAFTVVNSNGNTF